jgi:CRISPR-associated protein Csb1
MRGPNQYDHFLKDDGPAALVVREYLMPVEGADGVLFPATYAAAEEKAKFAGGYNIDTDERTGKNVALVDSVGSQANRIEVMFLPDKYDGRYAKLVPQIVVTAGEKAVNLLEAGHRAGDALVRCSSLQQELQDAFKAVLRGDAEPLAKIAPTSLVFGVWDSRDTQAKLPRVVASTIRAFDVRPLHRSAQYNPAAEYVNEKLLDEPADKATKDAYAERGFIHVPAAWSHGGVIADGGVRRDATLGLAALRLLRAGDDAAKTLALRRYALGLALVAFALALALGEEFLAPARTLIGGTGLALRGAGLTIALTLGLERLGERDETFGDRGDLLHGRLQRLERGRFEYLGDGRVGRGVGLVAAHVRLPVGVVLHRVLGLALRHRAVSRFVVRQCDRVADDHLAVPLELEHRPLVGGGCAVEFHPHA